MLRSTGRFAAGVARQSTRSRGDDGMVETPSRVEQRHLHILDLEVW
ncbi:MAG: hypothetical protein AVDCRST_MAG18-1060 [uncultured Thermomicrobiales bacterium]|uniref:Uncharacterized protein n=1 Tax=uncultured Thermomicrobiales bacterium TaxID=1645740 RepID=A0A6J4UV44_9BACT|nr:MAG: hypothetical protein AVDCRST_MAG18-1060 [uncultured Thermomicrobiales bacterium]